VAVRMVHQRTPKKLLPRKIVDIFLKWSFKDKKLDETVYTPKQAEVVAAKLREKFGCETTYGISLGQVLEDGRGRGGFQP